jgi:hypothetical protein
MLIFCPDKWISAGMCHQLSFGWHIHMTGLIRREEAARVLAELTIEPQRESRRPFLIPRLMAS